MVARARSLLTLTLGVLLVAACGERADSSPLQGSAQPQRDTGDEDSAVASSWVNALLERLQRIDEDMPGELGIHVRLLGEGYRLDYGDDDAWYLASTIKVPVAIAILEQVEAGELALQQELVLQRSDFVDGAGDLIWQEPGTRYDIATLLAKSLRHSDSTATDMLIRLIGEDHLNRRIRAWVGSGFGPVTTILQVRYDAYGELHPSVADLSNMDLVVLRNAEAGEPRLLALLDTLGVERKELAHDSIEAAFERYYEGGRNSAHLTVFADLLEKLVSGDLLIAEHTELVLEHMRRISTGGERISAGLPPGIRFAQKTGTQLGRACNMGVIEAGEAGAKIVVAVCARRFERIDQAEQAFQRIGRALNELVIER